MFTLLTNIFTEPGLTSYLIQVAPAVAVMGVVTQQLWCKYQDLLEKMHDRDLQNLRTLEQLLATLRHLETKGENHYEDLKQHISERVQTLREDIRGS